MVIWSGYFLAAQIGDFNSAAIGDFRPAYIGDFRPTLTIKVAMEMAIKSDRYNTGVKADPCVFVCLINFVASESHFWATARPAVSTGRCVPE